MGRSFIWPVTLVLATITGTVLYATATLLTSPVITAPNSAAGVKTVELFYQRVNHLLRIGDATPLAEIVASDFINHDAAPGIVSTRDGFVRFLLDLRTIYPSLQLVLEDIVAFGSRVAVRIRIEGAIDGQFLGFPLDDSIVPLGPVDLFHVADDRVVEHWGTPTRAHFEPFGTLPLDYLAGTPQLLTQTHWVFPARTSLTVTTAEGEHLFLNESGELTAIVERSDGESSMGFVGATNQRTPIRLGNAISLPRTSLLAISGKATIRLSNATNRDVSIIGIDVTPPGEGYLANVTFEPTYEPPAETTESTGVTTFPGDIMLKTIATSPLHFLPSAPVATIGRITLAPGASLPPNPLAGSTIIAVETGAIELETGSSQAWVRRGTSGARNYESWPTLSSGDGAYVPSGTPLGIRNPTNEPTIVVIFRIAPSGLPR